MSPLRRFHRVAPSPSVVSSTQTGSKTGPQTPKGGKLQSSSTLVPDDSTAGRARHDEMRPGSAPARKYKSEAQPYEEPTVPMVTVKPKAQEEPGKLT